MNEKLDIDVKTLKPFTKFIYTIGELPTSYLMSMTYEEQLVWLCNYLSKTVIPTINNNAEAVKEVQDLVLELQDYINNYFDNLDVTEEINNKLDKMAEDGTLTELIGDYVQPRIDKQNQKIEALKNNVNNEINIINNKVNNVISNNPIPVSSIDDMSDTSKIYVLTTDGYWYYYDESNLTWTRGRVYQSTEIRDGSINYNMFSDNLKEDLNYLTYYKDLLFTNDKTLIPLNKTRFSTKNVSNATGEQTINDIHLLSNDDLLYLPPYTSLSIELLNDFTITTWIAYYFDINKNYLGYASQLDFKQPIYIEDACYVRLMFNVNNITVTPDILDNILLYYNKKDDNKIKYKVNENLVDITKSTKNVYINNFNGTLYPTNNYSVTPYIPVVPNEVYKIKNIMRNYLFYDKFHNALQNTYVSTATDPEYVLTVPSNAYYFRFSYYNTSNEIMMTLGNETKPYVPFKKVLEDTASLSETMKKEIPDLVDNSNILSGKKLVACGDSFTQYTAVTGGSATHTPENWDEDWQCYKTYPYWIAKRNNMTLVNEAISGSTMTYLGTRTDAFSYNRYKELPTDADYIILKFGINDSPDHQNAPIGTIDDTTNETFYGAWNVVLEYMLNNYPNAKIGIIATNGATIDIVNATINIAKKWGIDYLNEGLGEDLMCWFRTSRTDVTDYVKNLLINRYSVDPVRDRHPNLEWHIRESAPVEHWLRRL